LADGKSSADACGKTDNRIADSRCRHPFIRSSSGEDSHPLYVDGNLQRMLRQADKRIASARVGHPFIRSLSAEDSHPLHGGLPFSFDIGFALRYTLIIRRAPKDNG
jgi:hypothetical protein